MDDDLAKDEAPMVPFRLCRKLHGPLRGTRGYERSLIYLRGAFMLQQKLRRASTLQQLLLKISIFTIFRPALESQLLHLDSPSQTSHNLFV